MSDYEIYKGDCLEIIPEIYENHPDQISYRIIVEIWNRCCTWNAMKGKHQEGFKE